MQLKICPKCQTETEIATPICAVCGHHFRTHFGPSPLAPVSQPVPPQYPTHSGTPPSPDAIRVTAGTHPVLLVVLLSLFCLPGLGSLVNRQYAKGVVWAFLTLAAAGITFFAAGLGALPLAIIGIVDQIGIANRLNRGETVEQWQFF